MHMLGDWFVVASQANKETLACKQLENQGFDVFLPLRKKTIRHSRRFFEVRAPLFPGYVFISFAPEPHLIRSVNGTLGVRMLIASGETPLHLPEGFVETLAASLCDDGTVSMKSMLRPGDQVEVANGPFARQVGTLLKLDDKGRVKILLRLLSTDIQVSAHISNLLPA